MWKEADWKSFFCLTSFIFLATPNDWQINKHTICLGSYWKDNLMVIKPKIFSFRILSSSSPPRKKIHLAKKATVKSLIEISPFLLRCSFRLSKHLFIKVLYGFWPFFLGLYTIQNRHRAWASFFAWDFDHTTVRKRILPSTRQTSIKCARVSRIWTGGEGGKKGLRTQKVRKWSVSTFLLGTLPKYWI